MPIPALRPMFRFVSSLVILALVFAVRCASAQDAQPAGAKAVLVLSSERSDVPAYPEFEKSLREGLASPAGRVEFFAEFLDTGRFPTAEHGQELERHLRARYAGRRIDLVVAFVDSAFEFALARRAALFPDVPIIGAAVERSSVEGRPLPASVAGVLISFDYRRTLELALALQPGAQEVVLVHGLAEFDLRRRDDARRVVEDYFASRLRYRMLSGVPIEEMEKQVGGLAADRLVLILSMVRDAQGLALVGADYAERLAGEGVTRARLFDFSQPRAKGALGGAITDWTEVGRATASVAAEVLAGRFPSQSVVSVAAPLRVNWPALEKWRIPFSRVPPEAQLLGREPGLWDGHRESVLAGAAALLLMTLLIAGLVAQLRRRRHAEAELRQSEARLRLALRAMPIAIVMVDQSGKIALANAQAEKLLGYQPGELEGLAGDALLPERLRSSFAPRHAEFFGSPPGQTATSREIKVRRKDGSEIRVEIGLTPVHSRDEMLVLTVMVDLSARQELLRKQQELEFVSRRATLGEITASLAHELGQPLAAILSNAQAGLRLLDRGNADTAEVRDILADVVADDRRASEVIGALRAMLRREYPARVPLDLADLARQVLALLHGALAAQKVRVQTDLSDGCLVVANKTQIEQVVLNLLMNGMEAMAMQPPQERRLRMKIDCVAGESARLEVEDAGVGIAPKDLASVFESFWTTKPAGLGMGLSICRSIVQAHGGDIRIDPNPERGVTAGFTLPLADQP